MLPATQRSRRISHRRRFGRVRFPFRRVFPEPKLALESDRIAGKVSGASAGTWFDASASARAATITNGTFQTGGQNGYPYVVFNGTNTVGAFQSLTLTGAFTIASVVRMNSTADNDPLLADVASTAYLWRFHDDIAVQIDTGASGVVEMSHDPRGTASAHVDIVRRNSSNLCESWLDGVKSADSGTHASSMVLNQIGKVESIANFLDANVYAIYIWDAALTDAGIAFANHFLRRKYKI